MTEYQVNQVFTPTKPAILSYTERHSKINNHLIDSLMTPGKQIVLYGHSGCGKTTLLINKLNETYESYFITRCTKSMGFDQVLLDGFDQLEETFTKTTEKKSFKFSPEISLDYQDIKASFKLFEKGKETESSKTSLIPPQLTPRKLAKFYGEAKACWVLEDFHKIKEDEKSKTSQLMKVFMDMSLEYDDVKIIAIGALGTARQVVEYDKEMNNRVSEIFVPYMSDNEISNIISTGEKLLNLKFSKDVKEKIIKFSCGLPSICHQLCLNICFNLRILKTQKNLKVINVDDLDKAIEKFLEEKSDSLKADYDTSVKVAKNTRNNLPEKIIEICLNIEKDEFTYEEILSKIDNKIFNIKDVDKILAELVSIKRAEILFFDEYSNHYRFSNLFLKAYCSLKLKDRISNGIKEKKAKIIERLLDIIEKDVYKKIELDNQ